MNSHDEEQVSIFKRYLLARADRSRSRLVKQQVRRWVEWIDAMQKREHERHTNMSERLRHAA